jgi:ABC-type polysaccharide/polyol phosphate export permease
MALITFLTVRWEKYSFLFTELVKRDFKLRYKRTALGIIWSLLSPLLQLLVMAIIFTQFFGQDNPHFIIYLFSGKLIYIFFVQATNDGMISLVGNGGVLTKINVPKYIFLFANNVAALINFSMTLVVFFLFVAGDGIPFHPRFFMLLFPILCILLFNIGFGLILSALYVFFRDMQYLYGIFTMLIMWLSAIFYPIEIFSPEAQQRFLFNPVYVYINYFRQIVLDATIPTLNYHLLCVFYSFIFLILGFWLYKRNNYKFIYYL